MTDDQQNRLYKAALNYREAPIGKAEWPWLELVRVVADLMLETRTALSAELDANHWSLDE